MVSLYKKIIYRILSIVLYFFSICIIWSECTFFVNLLTSGQVNLSIFFLIVKPSMITILQQLLMFLSLIYISLCTYYSLFMIRIFNAYHFVPSGATDSQTLLFSATNFGRLAPVITYNFLLMINKPSTFSNFMDEMSVIPISGTSFNYFVPIILVVVIIGTITNFHSPLIRYCNLDTFAMNVNGTEIENIELGQKIVQSERNILQSKNASLIKFMLNDII